jgi:hypothetical protein
MKGMNLSKVSCTHVWDHDHENLSDCSCMIKVKWKYFKIRPVQNPLILGVATYVYHVYTSQMDMPCNACLQTTSTEVILGRLTTEPLIGLISKFSSCSSKHFGCKHSLNPGATQQWFMPSVLYRGKMRACDWVMSLSHWEYRVTRTNHCREGWHVFIRLDHNHKHKDLRTCPQEKPPRSLISWLITFSF